MSLNNNSSQSTNTVFSGDTYSFFNDYINILDNNDNTILINLVYYNKFTDIVDLFNHNSKCSQIINHKNKVGYSALDIAIINRRLDVILFLLKMGADIYNIEIINGFNPIMCLIYFIKDGKKADAGKIKQIYKYFLNSHSLVDVNYVNMFVHCKYFYETPLIMAIKYNLPLITQILLDNGADVDYKDIHEYDAKAIAYLYADNEVYQKILNWKDSPSPDNLLRKNVHT